MPQSYYHSPLGWLEVTASKTAITAVCFVAEPKPDSFENALSQQGATQLKEYFNGLRTQFDLPLAVAGTEFQQAAWQALGTIPFGETRSYSEQAGLINRPKASRAIGAANSKNPFAIVVPCHRVIAQNGHLTGYASGLDKKQWLLDFERGVQSQQQ